MSSIDGKKPSQDTFLQFLPGLTANLRNSFKTFFPLVLIVLASVTVASSQASTTTTVTTSANSNSGCQSFCTPVFGQQVTFTATVATAGLGTPTGNVQFFDGAAPLGGLIALNGSGQAQYTTSSLSVGSHTIFASYAGNVPAGFNPSQGALNTNPQTVFKASTTTSITANQANPVGTGITVTYTATVSPVAPGAGTRTGTVTFNRNGLTACSNVTVNASGQATCSLVFGGGGSYNITAIYSGDANFNASNNNAAPYVQQVVGPPVGDTVTYIASSANPSFVGQSVTFTATVVGAGGPGTLGAGLPVSCGTVQFYDGANPLGALQFVNGAGQAKLTNSALTLGNHTITAQYFGGQFSNCTGWNPSTSAFSIDQTVITVPTAAPVYIEGRIVTETGRGVARASLAMVDSAGQVRYARTNSFGHYRFAEIPAGETYILTVNAKGFRSEQIAVNLNDSVTDMNVVLKRP